MNVRMVERHAIEAHLRMAIKRNEFVLFYQLKIDLRSDPISSVEALLPRQHPDFGLLEPARFLPVA